ncbi:hypothetical protein [Microcoleus sp. S13C4]|uniref:hypothetical protein n=1 Tax=Microcoleus sp. S13C4 TaxID=3055410 RepID=UPI002FCF2E05
MRLSSIANTAKLIRSPDQTYLGVPDDFIDRPLFNARVFEELFHARVTRADCRSANARE